MEILRCSGDPSFRCLIVICRRSESLTAARTERKPSIGKAIADTQARISRPPARPVVSKGSGWTSNGPPRKRQGKSACDFVLLARAVFCPPAGGGSTGKSKRAGIPRPALCPAFGRSIGSNDRLPTDGRTLRRDPGEVDAAATARPSSSELSHKRASTAGTCGPRACGPYARSRRTAGPSRDRWPSRTGPWTPGAQTLLPIFMNAGVRVTGNVEHERRAARERAQAAEHVVHHVGSTRRAAGRAAVAAEQVLDLPAPTSDPRADADRGLVHGSGVCVHAHRPVAARPPSPSGDRRIALEQVVRPEAGSCRRRRRRRWS